MLLFNIAYITHLLYYNVVSIHPILLFNGSNQYGKAFILDTSIHPMLLFNLPEVMSVIFKLIISIHPMLLFNPSYIFILKQTTVISIHSMLLFNFQELVLPSVFLNFNTSHVIIQPTKNRHSCILLISINHDLKPFYQHFTNHSIENQLFVRNHVFTPFDRLFQKITW